MRRLGVSRRQLFETVERPALASLPLEDYEFAEWRLARVSTDYHVEFKTFFYSVPQPHSSAGRSESNGAHHRDLPPRQARRGASAPLWRSSPWNHRRYAEWTPERFRRWATSIGPQTEALVIAILASRPHPEQGFRTCRGILRLFRDIDRNRAEAVSARAVEIGP
ncbi:hypothetical protein [Mesorhizobium sp.]|uniref:Mu transposase domain-containing protein n=1 Tax=Mesorhizobium sp. TaxID=1871066 RepID=UPI0025FBB531|nr:hypothetical protein [Mesorhizobium sp.]